MKLNLKFVSKIPKGAIHNEVIFLNKKNIKSKNLKEFDKSVFSSKLFSEKKIIKKDYKNKNYVFVNCMNSTISLDFEKLGSKLFLFLKENNIENSFISEKNNSITSSQLEKILHGIELKSYNFNIYKSQKEENINISLMIVGNKIQKKNLLRNKLNALKEGIFLTRDLVSEPGNILHPDEYTKRITKLKKLGLKVTVYNQSKII